MPKRPRMPFPRPLSGLVQENLVGLGLVERLREAEIWRIWPDVVGAALAARACPVRIINGTLTEAAERVLLLGDDQPPAEVQDDIVPAIPLTAKQLALIEAEAASITDPETRQAFIELMRASLEQQR